MPIVRQSPFIIVQHSRSDRANARPSTNTGNPRHRFDPRAVATRSVCGPPRCTSTVGAPRSSMLSMLTTIEEGGPEGRVRLLRLLRLFRELPPAEQDLFFEGVELLAMGV